jgi:hypothetical protein
MAFYAFTNDMKRPTTGQVVRNILVLLLVLAALFFIARGIFRLLVWVAPVLFILTLFIRFRVVSNFVKTLYRLVRRKPLVGIAAIVLTVFAFPLVAVFLFGQAVFSKKLDDARKEYEQHTIGEETEYEEMGSELHAEDLRHRPMVRREEKYDAYFRDED